MNNFSPDDGSDDLRRTHDPDVPLTDGVDNTLAGYRQEVRDQAQDCSGGDPKKPDRITPSTFFKRLQLLLQEPLEPHLKAGVGLLASIVESHPDLIRKINEKDGPQVLVQAFVNYLNEHYTKVCQELLTAEGPLKSDIELFVKDYVDKKKMGTRQEMTTLYLAQLTHMAFHILYYNYKPVMSVSIPDNYRPVRNASAPNSTAKSCILLTRFGSIITGSQFAEDMLHAHYLRITKRDDKEANSPISIFEGVVRKMINHTSARLNVEPWRIGNYQDFSATRILAIKDGMISQREMGEMTECTTSLTSSCTSRMRDLLDMMRESDKQRW